LRRSYALFAGSAGLGPDRPPGGEPVRQLRQFCVTVATLPLPDCTTLEIASVPAWVTVAV